MSPPPQPLRRRFGLRTWDFVLFGLGFLLTTGVHGNVPGTDGPDGVSDAGMLVWLVQVAAWVTVLFRRSRPRMVLGAGLLLALIGSEYLLFLIGVLHVLLATRGRPRIATAAGATAVVALYVLREATTPWGGFLLGVNDGDAREALVYALVIAVLSLGTTFAMAAVLTSRRTAIAATGRADVQQAKADHLSDELARQAEREDIAREIHDGLTNRLALLAMMGGNVERAVDTADPHAPELARQLTHQSREALYVSESTVKSQLDSIRTKLTVSSREEIAVLIERAGETQPA